MLSSNFSSDLPQRCASKTFTVFFDVQQESPLLQRHRTIYLYKPYNNFIIFSEYRLLLFIENLKAAGTTNNTVRVLANETKRLDECPDNATYTVSNIGERFPISWLDVSGDPVITTMLSVGEHVIQYQINDTTDCFIFVSVRGKNFQILNFNTSTLNDLH